MICGRRILAVLACHGRRAETLSCLHALFDQDLPDGAALQAILVDDGSPDDTADAVEAAFPQVRILRGDGSLWWGGAMRLGLREAAATSADLHLWLNDDVRLDRDAVATLLAAHDDAFETTGRSAIVVGATRDPQTAAVTYGGQRRPGGHPLKLVPVRPDGSTRPCDTFQGNVVSVPAAITRQLDGIGPEFLGVQGMADTDFGLRAHAAGIPIRLAGRTVGVCPRNMSVPPWHDRGLPLRRRLSALRGPRGFPPRAFLTLMRRHGGALWWWWALSAWSHAAAEAIWPPPPARAPCRLALLEGVVPPYRLSQLAGLADMPGLEVTVYVGTGIAGWSATSVPVGMVPLPTVAVRNRFWPLGRGRRLWTGGTLAALCDRADAAVIGFHVHDLAVWLLWLTRRILGRPRLILSGHFRLDPEPDDAPLRSGLRRRLRILLARGADAVLPYTPQGAAACRRHGIPEERIHVTHNSVDTARIRATAGAPRGDDAAVVRAQYRLSAGPFFLSVGRLYPAKRFEVATAALAALRTAGRDCSLVLVGDGPERPRLEAMAGPTSGVCVAGPLTEESELAPLFREATALILPASAGLAVLHAFAYGVPVIACAGRTHGPEIAYLQPGRNGLLAETLDATALAGAMARMLDDDALRARLSAGALATAEAMPVAAWATALAAALGPTCGTGNA